MSNPSYNVMKRAALAAAADVYRARAKKGGGTFEVGGRRWNAPKPGYDVITAVANDRLPVKIGQIVERQTGPKQLQFSGDVAADGALVVAVVDQHLVDGQ